MDLDKLYSNLSNLDVIDICVEIIENDLSEFINDLNRKQMADKGKRSDGSQLSPEYTDLTEWFKRQKSGTAAITGHVTLFDTGDLHKSIFSGIVSDSLVLDSNDWKVSELTQKYGEFLGLTDESIKLFQDKFNPLFIEKLESAILQ